jgi:hypothetical protein
VISPIEKVIPHAPVKVMLTGLSGESVVVILDPTFPQVEAYTFNWKTKKYYEEGHTPGEALAADQWGGKL